jgi:hypothetical protein
VQIAVVAGGPRLGDLESGAVANAFGPVVSVASGGLACIAGALLLARLLPGFGRQEAPAPASPAPVATGEAGAEVPAEAGSSAWPP